MAAGRRDVRRQTVLCIHGGGAHRVDGGAVVLHQGRIGFDAQIAVIDVTEGGFQLVELAPGVSFDYENERTGAELLPIAAGVPSND